MNTLRLDLREQANAGCLSCDPTARKDLLENGLCTQTQSVMDQLPIRCVGEWAYDKIYWLVQYFGIFAGGMKNRWRGNLSYLEICSGPGRCITRNDRMEMDGSALAMIRDPKFRNLRSALFVDSNPKVVEALNKRIKAAQVGPTTRAELGNYQNSVAMQRLLSTMPKDCLNLVFLDPTDCGIPFAAIKLITEELNNVDFIINVALNTDANRNLVSAILNPAFSDCREKYESFLGATGFCTRPDVVKRAKNGELDALRLLFLDEYRKSLKGLGFIHSAAEQVKHYYYLLFASRHQKGLDFWREVTKIRPDSQRTMILFSN